MLLKLEDRVSLYYNRYNYKVVVSIPNLRYVHSSKNYEQFEKRLEHEKTARPFPYGPQPMTRDDCNKIRSLIDYRKKISTRFDVTIRKEMDSIAFYSNNLDLLKEVQDFSPSSRIFQVNLMPAGVMTFVREPQYKYRVYIKNGRISLAAKNELAEYINRTQTVKPCPSLNRWLNKTYNNYYNYVYSQGKHFLEFDDAGVLTLLHLLCPEILGKSYKLQKR